MFRFRRAHPTLSILFALGLAGCAQRSTADSLSVLQSGAPGVSGAMASRAVVARPPLGAASVAGRSGSAGAPEQAARDAAALGTPMTMTSPASTTLGAQPAGESAAADRSAAGAVSGTDNAGGDTDAGLEPTVQALDVDDTASVARSPTGEPLLAPDGVWTYVAFPDTRCRDGSTAGISLRLNSQSTRVLIYLEGGVYCFDETTCALNPSNVDDVLFNSAKREPTTGIFDRRNPDNPVRSWNIVYVPYCTGDAMAGAKPVPTDVPGGPNGQLFVGRSNLESFLKRIVPTFPHATDVLLTGMSAGGSSVLASVASVARAFAPLQVRFVNDSSLPPASGEVLPACMQRKMRELWGLADTVLKECGADCTDQDNFWRDYSVHIVKTFADRPTGYIDAIEDEMMRMVGGLGARDCTGNLLFDVVAAPAYREALFDYREAVAGFTNHSTFFPEGTRHTWLKDSSFYTGRAGDTSLSQWFGLIASGQAPGHAGP